MVDYVCDKCSKLFKQKSKYMQHTKRKTPCNKNIVPSMQPTAQPIVGPTSIVITHSLFSDVCAYYDTVLNIDKSTYVSSNDEPTPMNCVKELIDSIPINFWKNPNLRILDPCCGNGNFGVHLYNKLIPHHTKQTVLEDILEFNDINEPRLDNVRRIFDADNNRLQITQHDFLVTSYTKKYELIVANPPYAKILENGKRASKNHNLIKDFIKKSLELLTPDGYLLFITPDNWMSYADRNDVIKILTKLQIVRLDIHNAKKYFKKIGSSFTWYLIQNRPAGFPITVSGIWKKQEYISDIPSIERKYIPLLYTNEVYNILSKTIDADELEKYRVETSSDLHRYTKREIIRDEADDIYKYRLIHTAKQTCYASRPHKFQEGYKVFITTTDKYKVFVDDCGMTQSIVFIRCSCLDDANHIKTILEHPLYVFINNLCRWGNFNNIRILQSFPVPQIDSYDETTIYRHFNITDEEIKFINEH
jgi:adenine-specific DNA-methyltransferase